MIFTWQNYHGVYFLTTGILFTMAVLMYYFVFCNYFPCITVLAS